MVEIIQNAQKLLKTNHYIKNIVVFIPLLFSMNFTNITMFLKCLIIFISFCLISSAVYIMNDLADIEYDRVHPVKCKRLIASGKISIPAALSIMFTLIIISSALAFKLNILSLLSVLAYFILNIFYTLKLKDIPLIDTAIIAIGFILRILAGCSAILVIPSPLVIILTFFVSMFFTFTKRKLELQLIIDNTQLRKSLNDININLVNQFILINAILSISFYFTYMLDQTTIERAGCQYLYVTVIPFTLIMFRLLLLSSKTNINDDPTHFFEKDKTLIMLLLSFLITFIIVMVL